MSLEKDIYKDMLNAMKSGDTLKRETLRFLLSEIKKENIDSGRKGFNDQDIIKIIKSGLKKRQEALELFRQGNRQDLVDKTQKEIKILEVYLPKQLTREEIERIVTDAITTFGKNQGLIMKEIMSKYGSQVDGKTVREIVSARLSLQQ